MRYGQRVKRLGDDRVRVIGQCSVTGDQHAVEVSEVGLARWLQGALIQNALPDATPDEREFLMSGTSPEGWARLFPECAGGGVEPTGDTVEIVPGVVLHVCPECEAGLNLDRETGRLEKHVPEN